MEKQYKRLNNIVGWIVLFVAVLSYYLTLEPSNSFWDCGEFIAASQKLMVVHPPGAPLFLMIGRLFTLLAGGNPEMVPVMVNLMSALCTAFSMMFLCWITTYFARKIVAPRGSELTSGKINLILACGLVAGLTATFLDSIWFSAVEAEVYSMSLFFTALVSWLMTKWDQRADEPFADRYLILIVFLMGCSIFVHWLNLLTIPALGFIYYFRRYPRSTSKGMLATFVISIVIILFFLEGIITGLVDLMASVELKFVNVMGFGFNTGMLISVALFLVALVTSLAYTYRPKNNLLKMIAIGAAGAFVALALFSADSGGMLVKRVFVFALVGGLVGYLGKRDTRLLNNLIWAFTFVMIGYSTLLTTVIRANANPIINMNSPKDIVSLASYLHRDQYGSRPLLKGVLYTEKPTDVAYTGWRYQKGETQYDKTGQRFEYTYEGANQVLFPRIYDSDHKDGYERWLGLRKNQKPTYFDNIRFFFKYQLNHMYFRYLFWNFVGRQNDEQGYGVGDPDNGNWISGVGFIDNMRLGDQSFIPESDKNHPARNTFYFIPLLLAIMGLAYQVVKDRKGWFVVFLLFFFMGMALIIYGNSPPVEPRERDYIFAGSFWAFSIWVGLSVLFIHDLIASFGGGKGESVLNENDETIGAVTSNLKQKVAPTKFKVSSAGTFVGIALALMAPFLLAFNGWDDHDRSDRYAARDFAANYLNSCAPNAILFTQGDNDTYPLWYAQEVEGIRTDVRIVNLSLLGVDWYINQIQRRVDDADPVKTILTPDKIRGGLRDMVMHAPDERIAPEGRYINLTDIIKFLGNDKYMRQSSSGDKMATYPTQTFSIPVDKAAVLQNGTVHPNDAGKIVDKLEWKMPRRSLLKNDLMVLDIVAANAFERPIYFAISVDRNSYLGLQKYFQLEGLTYRIVPIPSEKPQAALMGRVQTEIMYDNLMNKFSFGNVNQEGVMVNTDIKRLLFNMKNTYVELAEALVSEGKRAKAIEVLDRCQAETFYPGMEYDFYLFTVIAAYYDAGGLKKGNELMDKVVDQVVEELNFIERGVSAADRKFYKKDRERYLAVLEQFVKIATSEKQLDMARSIADRMQPFR